MIERIVIAFIIGAAIGAVVVWLILRSAKKELENVRRDKSELDLKVKQVQDQLEQNIRDVEVLRNENKQQVSKIAELQTARAFLDEKLEEQKIQSEKAGERMKMEFENLSNQILNKSSKKITDQNKSDLDAVLKPFKEKIIEFETKVENKHVADARDRAQLIEKIAGLTKLNEQMQAEAKNLTTALKGDSKKQGNWGELVLERVLENSGLEKGSEYITQQHVQSEDGKRLHPDVIIKLPQDKHVVIDSKVSLTAYERVIAAESPEEKAIHIKQHIISVKNHIKELNEKNYQHAVGVDSPDFVLMFMPIEASFSLAVKEDNEIFKYAWDKKVVIVSPSTLLATLRTISSLWTQEKQTKNALEIAKQAGALYDKFVGFSNDLIDIGKKIDTTKKAYQESMKKLTEGTGNLVRRVESIKKLGAKTTKSINENLKNRASLD